MSATLATVATMVAATANPVHNKVTLYGTNHLLVTPPQGTVINVYRNIVQTFSHHIIDITPGATTILIQPKTSQLQTFIKLLEHAKPQTDLPNHTRIQQHFIPVIYNGVDLPHVGKTLNMRVETVIQLFETATFTVGFHGFTPGFSYLTGLPNPLNQILRHPAPRSSVPSGSVALAAGYAAIYPRTTPGGWNLIGHTKHPMFNTATGPSFNIGDTVKFVRSVDDIHS